MLDRKLTVFLALVSAAARADEAKVADQELGARVGASLNIGGTAPGGFYVAGNWLYRLTDILWFDGRAGFAIGGGGSICSSPTTGAPRCDAPVVNGFGVEILAGLRWFVPTDGKLAPWIGGGVGALIANFSGDDLTGAGIPFWFAAGVRTRISETVSIGAEADLSFAPVHYGRSIGWENSFGLKFLGSVGFAL